MMPSCLGATVRRGRATPPATAVIDVRGAPVRFVATPRHAWFGIDGRVSFSVRDGTEVVVEVESDAAEVDLDGYLQATVAALVLAQRGEFAIHATAVDIDGAAVAMSGPRGIGKSTTALGLVQRGGRLLADDVLPLTRAGERIVMHPTGRALHVFPHAARRMDYDLGSATRLGEQVDKVALAVPVSGPRPLDAVALLTCVPDARAVSARRIAGVDAFGRVHENIYRIELLASLYPRELFSWAADVAASVPVFEIERPAGDWTLAAVVEQVRVICAAVGGGRDAAAEPRPTRAQ